MRPARDIASSLIAVCVPEVAKARRHRVSRGAARFSSMHGSRVIQAARAWGASVSYPNRYTGN